ncbi:Spermidine/putrescine transport system permease protein PotB [Sebaldella termitidis]|uniref:Binding-protein-dependent transport systems inner membrane component n=1 Tax=Sebaldella termitidis (strain ATCC 33386 / NCTC 11300) TaxID=526218 RepID=D1AFV1_SEBTE|nr:ABC transporter permease [Sebaldella termitidis]ACZ07986.1 binding-protein-dependent transport systems inner membrane component [Sebaldella termitidis ATCC 33386]MBP7979975.1 ABC transporter permease [Sebaldella sp.]SUI23287.1 Spermidine/putrescine transport system permease protein PotB [Sebaldella termitidis]
MGKKGGFSYYISLLLWLTAFFVIPTLIIAVISFLKKGPYGGVIFWQFSLDAYANLFDKVFLKIIFKTLEISIWVTIVTLVLALPTAYYISRSKLKSFWLLLIIIPFWTNFLVRIYSFIAILGNNGIVNKALQLVFNLDGPIQLLYNKNAVIIVTVYIYLPYAILPLYSSIEKFDFSLLDAARDLGATKFKAMVKVFLPGIKSGLISAIILTFIPAVGSYAVPDLLGGNDALMLGNIIGKRLLDARDWPIASAVSMLLIVFTTIAVLLFMRSDNGEDE